MNIRLRNLVNRGEVKVSSGDILETRISVLSLDTYSFDGTGHYVELAESPNSYVIGDAIKWELQP